MEFKENSAHGWIELDYVQWPERDIPKFKVEEAETATFSDGAVYVEFLFGQRMLDFKGWISADSSLIAGRILDIDGETVWPFFGFRRPAG